MNKYGKKILYILSIVVTLALLLNLNNETKKESVTNQFIEIIDKDEEKGLNKNQLEYYQKEIKKELNGYLDKDKNNYKIRGSYYAIGAIKYLENEYDEAIHYLKEALKYHSLRDEKKSKVDIDVRIYSALSSSYIQKKEIKESTSYFIQAKSIALDNNEKHLLCEVYYGRAKALTQHNIYEAIDLMRKALEYTDTDTHRVRNYLYLSTLYKVSKEFDLAIEYTLNALEISMKLEDTKLINQCLINLGENYYIQKNYLKTIQVYKNLIENDMLINSTNILTVYGYLAESYARIGDYLSYMLYRDEYFNIAKRTNAIRDLMWMCIVSADIEIDYQNIKDAEVYLVQAEKLYSKNENDMYANMDILLAYVKSKMEYVKGGEYEQILNKYNILLEELKNRGVKVDLVDTILNEILNISYKQKDYKSFLTYLAYVAEDNRWETSQVYTDSIFSGINNTIKEKEIVRIKLGVVVLCITSGLSIYGFINSLMKNKKIYKLNQELREKNIIDAGTKVYNKAYLNEKLKCVYENGEKISFIMIDIDYFKLYNDNYGHLKGDEALLNIAMIIKTVFSDDMVFRYGGEEFSVLSYKSREELLPYLDKLNTEVYNKNIAHRYSEVSDRITVSMGIAIAQASTEKEVIAITREADENLYKSKEQGRNRYTISSH